jgi:hypothetical protein
MYCPQCGNANDDAATSCTTCGMDLQKYRNEWSASQGGPAEPPAGQGPAAGQQPAAPSAYPPPYRQEYQPTYQTPPYQTPPYQPGPYQQPAGYQPAGYQRGYGPVPNIPSHMAWAIITLILCFWPTGIVAVVYASKVGNRLSVGDVPGAQEASRNAKTWTWVTFGIGIALYVIVILIGVLAAVATVNTIGS